MKALDRYTAFSYVEACTTDARIILIDEPLQPDVRMDFETLETIDGHGVIFFEDTLLTAQLEEVMKGISMEKETLLVFPGNGANYPRKLSRFCREFPKATSVEAKRFWVPGKDPVVTVGLILPSIYIITRVKKVVVVDDVISSGLTMRRLYQKNAWRFPAAQWVGVSWMSQIPQMKAKSGVSGYERIATVCVVAKSNGGKVPINSLSTLRQDSEIAESYAQRHFRNPPEFLRLIRK